MRVALFAVFKVCRKWCPVGCYLQLPVRFDFHVTRFLVTSMESILFLIFSFNIYCVFSVLNRIKNIVVLNPKILNYFDLVCKDPREACDVHFNYKRLSKCWSHSTHRFWPSDHFHAVTIDLDSVWSTLISAPNVFRILDIVAPTSSLINLSNHPLVLNWGRFCWRHMSSYLEHGLVKLCIWKHSH